MAGKIMGTEKRFLDLIKDSKKELKKQEVEDDTAY